MRRSLFLLLVPVIACSPHGETGPTPTTVAIMTTEPVEVAPTQGMAPQPELAAVVDSFPTTVESDGMVAAGGPEEPPVPMERTLAIEVRSGENLVLLARWADSSVEVLAELNGLDPTENLFPGQSLLIPSDDEACDETIVRTRDTAAQARLDGYLDRRGGLMAVEEHRVRTGETAWGIAREQLGIPTWVLAAYNPETDLEHLGIGERLLVPVLADTVAELEPEEEQAEEPAPMEEPEPVEIWEVEPSPEPADEVTLPDELDMPEVSATVKIQEE